MGYAPKKGDGFNMKKLTNGIIRRFDLNGDGKLSFQEFKYSLKPGQKALNQIPQSLTIQDLVNNDFELIEKKLKKKKKR